jgi:uncharacterized membrane protein YeaQ/YmgE (transglycosylase-associated protein family)
LLAYLGLTHLNNQDIWLLLLVAICLSIALGWVMDLIMRNVGFGTFGNCFISLLGIVVGLAGYHYLYKAYSLRNMPITLFFVVGSIMSLLLILSWLRRVLKL